jgi:hypothetical protein
VRCRRATEYLEGSKHSATTNRARKRIREEPHPPPMDHNVLIFHVCNYVRAYLPKLKAAATVTTMEVRSTASASANASACIACSRPRPALSPTFIPRPIPNPPHAQHARTYIKYLILVHGMYARSRGLRNAQYATSTQYVRTCMILQSQSAPLPLATMYVSRPSHIAPRIMQRR